jgi:mRNA-degrading endonuclease RelE of RelBE toxin-antitoxin system
MRYEIEFTEQAERHLSRLSARDRAVVLDAIEQQLRHQPTVPTRNRKELRPNPLAPWELRVGSFRVFYDVDGERVIVLIVAIGAKEHNVLRIEGKEYRL